MTVSTTPDSRVVHPHRDPHPAVSTKTGGLARRHGHGAPISIRNLHKSFGRAQVLKGISLEIPAGQFVAVVGRSGCGKSTLLRILVGLDTASDGVVQIGGSDGVSQAPRIMFQEPRLLPWQSVLENVEVGLGQERSAADQQGRAAETLRAVGLQDKSGQWPSTLSGGQRQRVALARALVSRPRVMALDEPLGALDALTRLDMQSLLEGIWLDEGFTALLVTHDVAEAVALADRIVVIDDGRVTLDLPVDLPRPRRRGTPDAAAIEQQVLNEILKVGETTAARRQETAA